MPAMRLRRMMATVAMTHNFPTAGIYYAALLNYVLSSDESGLAHAYEIGRLCLNGGCGLLQILQIHDDAVALMLDGARPGDDVRGRVHSAARFLHEALSPFGMASAGYRDLVKGG